MKKQFSEAFGMFLEMKHHGKIEEKSLLGEGSLCEPSEGDDLSSAELGEKIKEKLDM